MKQYHRLGQWNEVRAVAEPLRMRILEAFSRQPRTTKQVAIILGEKPTRLYHHVQILERAGLIKQVETRRNRGMTEKYYSAVAKEFIVDRKLLEIRKGAGKAARGYESLLLSALEATLEEARKSVAAGLISSVEKGRNALICRHQVRGPKADIDQLMARIGRWIKECRATAGEHRELSYTLTLAFYPVKRSPRRSTGKRRKNKTRV